MPLVYSIHLTVTSNPLQNLEEKKKTETFPKNGLKLISRYDLIPWAFYELILKELI